MSESFEKAVEVAAILSCATLNQDRIWRNFLDEEDREDYRKEAAAMLTAALPHLTAQDVPHLIRQAKAKAWDEGYRASGIVYPTLPPKHPTNPYAEETTDDHA